MASRKEQQARSQNQNDRSDQSDTKRSSENQHERAVHESSRILKHIIGDAKGYSTVANSKWGKQKRIPRLYYINENQTILIILQGDITKTKVDAIVNAANQHMTGGSGVDGMIHHAAGGQLYDACVAHKEVKPGVRLPTGHSRILLSYDMSATTNYIINTAGPVTALALANLYDLESIGFTAISCGIFGYPADAGARVALQTVDQEASTVPVVVFVLWDDHIYDAWVEAAEKLRFPLYDSQKASTSKPSFSNDQNQDTADVSKSPSSTFNPKIIDGSTQRSEEKTSKGESDEHVVKTAPSPVLDTKQHDDLEDGDPQSKTTKGENVDPERQQGTTPDPTGHDDSKPVLTPIENKNTEGNPDETSEQSSTEATHDSPTDGK